MSSHLRDPYPLDHLHSPHISWNANATGQYTGFAASSAPGAPGGFPGGPGGPIPTGFPTFPPFPTGTGLPPFPTGFPPPGGPGGGGPPLTDGGSGLRGGYPTNKEGLVGIKTIYPGFYSGRTVHIHVMVHSNWEASDNGYATSLILRESEFMYSMTRILGRLYRKLATFVT